ncbi:MAG: tRNA 2-thiocytidine(32) synthetase TtcA [Deltaproteobacteria bacterium]|nr:tRNA 2-thiocytidine(32) synthetase TtcA [Deltaproteobacteria bacterium]
MAELKLDQGTELRLITKEVGRAIGDFALIEDGDRVMVAVSGGKDSYALLHALLALKRRAPVDFAIEAVNLDPGYPGYQTRVVKDHVEDLGVKIHMLDAPIHQLVQEKIAPGQPACPLCSRIRRGTFYTLCQRLGFNKLALGHHLDDAVETLLMNMFYGGAMRAMPPILVRDEAPAVIRPLCYVLERTISDYARAVELPVIPCASAHCADADRRRQVIKRHLTMLEADHPEIKNSVRRAMGNIDPRFLFVRAQTPGSVASAHLPNPST